MEKNSIQKMSEKRWVDDQNYQKCDIQKSIVFDKLREHGCRITKQRKIILNIILKDDCICCKDIYFQAIKEDSEIGLATIYRMLNLLEEIGAINRRKMYQLSIPDGNKQEVCKIILSNRKTLELNKENLNKVLQEGLRACGFTDHAKVESVILEKAAN